MKKFFRKVHLWLSVPFGLVIMTVCLTGAILIWEEEINMVSSPELYKVAPQGGGSPMHPKQVAALVSSTLPDSVEVTGITVSDNPEKTWMVALSKPHHTTVAVNPYTGEIKGRVQRSPFFMAVFKLHRFLLDSPAKRGEMTVGKAIVGISTIMFVLVLISGIVWWWPKKGKGFLSRLKISVTGGWPKFWHGLHLAGGMYALIFLLAMALTGLTWSFGWYRTAFYSLLGDAPKMEQRVEHVAAGKEKRQHAMRNVQETGRQKRVHGESAGNDGMRQGKMRETEGARHERDGHRRNIKENDRQIKISHDTDRPTTVQGWVFQIHTGKWGGIIVKLIYTIAALIGASLPVTGYYFWIRRLRKKRKCLSSKYV